ncbi:MAG: nitroreductase family deazaflavin-dependent oxidoreductase [Hamadaea sp.]|uniref:nitroreductase/quinone reductase family protein n=1 Tax=Hamadaea sp. TaxID=2024425 RepID=UPI001855739E|nr:nitroreductase/quinone reductase family protein [Hamadaea sp.]NUR47470.1 nitroreductase family deazaflavin-dependent oxidoreductase [Hamadaea sp.]NUT18871.1 nitroreductase family deazaflavin-dependent oxidoreductase [Hamadaea sp.]
MTGNVAVLAVLRSPLHTFLDSRLCALRYLGPQTGRLHTFPVQYVTEGEGAVLVAAGHADRKSWWRIMGSPWPVQLLLDGRWHDGVAQLVTGAQAAAARAAYRRVFRRTPDGVPVVRIVFVVGAAPRLTESAADTTPAYADS